MKTALLEIGVETLPARFIPTALSQLESLAARELGLRRLAFGKARALGSPMRLALLIEDLADESAQAALEAKGPPARMLKDASGAFTPQAEGFARSQGLRPEDLQVADSPKGPVLVARKVVLGRPAARVLEEAFPAIIAAIEFPKSMEWEESRLRFGRPIRGLLALCGARVVSFSLAGVRSSSRTRGLAALGGKAVRIGGPGDYVRRLREACVLVDPQERMEALRRGLEAEAARSAGSLDGDGALLDEVLFLCEHPVPVLGTFDKAFLELPRALLRTVLKTQLKFFPLLDRGGAPVAEFIGVRDGTSEGQSEVRRGFERVVEARLSDARFFFRRDLETPLRLKRGKLAAVGFQKGLGSMLDKAERVKALALKLCERLRQEVAFDEGAAGSIAELCYCDLVSEVVGEFPELQGAMGAVYARREGLGERVALGLSEFYFPVHARGPLPSHLEGCLASLAGKLDTVAALFAAGLRPSGSEDPYALRRQGNGAVRILLEKQVRVPAGEILRDALGLLGPGVSFDQEAVLREAGEFLWQRAETLFLEQGFKVDEIRAVREGGLDDLPRTYKRLAALRAMRKEADFAALALAFKRASNILRQAPGGLPEPDPARFVEISERALCAALSRVEGEVRSRAAAEEFEPALRALSRLKPDLDAFFDQVLVMAEDGALRANRLALLGRLVGLFKSVADVSQIQG